MIRATASFTHSSPAVSDGAVYIAGDDANVYRFDLAGGVNA
jgi:outer membrane protein assembly factor BamB